MRQISKQVLIILFLSGLSYNLEAGNFNKADSVAVNKVIDDFYDWYLSAIKEKKYTEFKPVFIKNDQGMTTLDYSVYIKNLKKHHFSDSLIAQEIKSYQECINNLLKVNYSDFQKTVYTDLDEYEDSKCDFGNYYRWIGGQEPIDGVRITEVQFKEKGYASITIEYFSYSSKDNMNYYWGNSTVILRKINNAWKIDSIGLN